MKLGILVESEEGLTWERWRRIVAAGEQLGFDSAWISDHLLSAAGEDRGGLDAWLALAVAAAESRRITLGPLVTPITFRLPGLLARMASSLQALSGGRFVLGLGIGWNEREHATFGIPFPPGAERLHLLETGLELIKCALGQPVPILVGGMGRGTLRLVARHADEWNLTTNSPEVFSSLSASLAEVCRSIGRQPEAIRRSVSVGVLIGRDAAEMRARAERLRRLVPGLDDTPTEDVLAVVRARGWVAGTPAEVACALRALAAAGVDRAMLGHYDPEDIAALELIAREVLPALTAEG